jgi:hypothetical protein
MAMSRFAAAALAASMILASPTAQAHHAINAQFDPAKNVEMTGTLFKVELINPHSYLQMYVKDAKGENQLWAFETGAPSALRKAGVTSREAFKIGENYSFSVHPSRDGSRTGLINTITLPDGRKIGMGSAQSLGIQ